MLKSTKDIIVLYCQMITVWNIAILIFFFLRTFGLPEHMHNLGLENHLPTHFSVALNLVLGTVAGILFASSELFFNRPKFKRWSFRNILIFKAIVYFLGAKLMMLMGIVLSSHAADQFLSFEVIKELLNELVLQSPFKSIDIGEVQLKGKMQTVALYGIQH